MGVKMILYNTELNILEVLWEFGDLSAGQMTKIMEERVGWKRQTTYTIIKQCIDKGLVERIEPNYICRAKVTREEIQKNEISILMENLFDNSPRSFLYAFTNCGKLSEQNIAELHDMIEKME